MKPYLQAGAALIAGLDIWVADIGVYAKGTIINTELKFGAMVGYDPAGH